MEHRLRDPVLERVERGHHDVSPPHRAQGRQPFPDITERQLLRLSGIDEERADLVGVAGCQGDGGRGRRERRHAVAQDHVARAQPPRSPDLDAPAPLVQSPHLRRVPSGGRPGTARLTLLAVLRRRRRRVGGDLPHRSGVWGEHLELGEVGHRARVATSPSLRSRRLRGRRRPHPAPQRRGRSPTARSRPRRRVGTTPRAPRTGSTSRRAPPPQPRRTGSRHRRCRDSSGGDAASVPPAQDGGDDERRGDRPRGACGHPARGHARASPSHLEAAPLHRVAGDRWGAGPVLHASPAAQRT